MMKRILVVAVSAFLTIGLALAEKKEKPLGPYAIPAGTTIFIEPNEGFETYLRAAFERKKVPLLIVIEKEKADLWMTSTLVSGKEPSTAAAIFLGKRNANQDASISIVDLKTKVVRYSYAVHKYNAANGKQSAAEAIAKNVRKKVESRQ